MKLPTLSIFAKIWLSLVILIGGYVFSVLAVHFLGHRVTEDLDRIAAALFPAAIQSQNAQSQFERLTKLYEDAVLMGETALLETAEQSAAATRSHLSEIAGMTALPARLALFAEGLNGRILDFAERASALYGHMAQTGMDELLSETDMKAMSDLQTAKEAIAADLEALRANLREELQMEIAGTQGFFERQRRINFGLFWLVLTISLISIWLAVRISVEKPIRGAVERLRGVSDSVRTASEQVAAGSRAMADGAAEQAAGVEETASTLETLAGATRRNAEHAESVQGQLTKAAQLVSDAQTQMERMAEAIQEITESSRETERVVGLINEIAFQTNLLALNAAVEAARAGESGAGFSVVAQEVRNLARRAGESADSTGELIHRTIQSVENGTKLSASALGSVRANAAIADEIAGLADQILRASREQADGIEQVNQTVGGMDARIQSGTVDAEASAHAARELAGQVEVMADVVAALGGLISGKRNPA